MASRNTTDSKRFVHRVPNKKIETSLVPSNATTPRKSSPPAQATHRTTSSSPLTTSRSVDTTTSSVNAPPARRVVVVRNPNNPNAHRGPIDLGDFGQPSARDKYQPVLSNGRTSIYLIRRSIHRTETSQTAEQTDHEQKDQ